MTCAQVVGWSIGALIAVGLVYLAARRFMRGGGAKAIKVEELKMEDVIKFFKQPGIAGKLASVPDLTAVAIKDVPQKGIVALCLFDNKTQTMVEPDNATLYEPVCLDSALEAAFGDKKMLLLK